MLSSKVFSSVWQCCFFSICVSLLISVAGCDSGPERYTVSGTVTFNGTPVPIGQLVFTPDHPKGNKGPQGVADIYEGEISQNARKMVGGPHWMQVQAFDGKEFEGEEMTIKYGKDLLPMQMVEVDLPKADAKLTIDIKEISKGKFSIDVKVEED